MKYFVIFSVLLFSIDVLSQKDSKWDNTISKQRPEQCEKVNIVSTIDRKKQPAYFYKSVTGEKRPLIISLHTWSGDYEQEDTLSWMCVENNYNYIHPDFRGPNNRYEACGSPFVISDIDDAIDYAIVNGNVDLNEIHVIGVSGGGYATLLMYMKSKHRIKTFSAWASISNLEEWYWESLGRKNRYYKDIAKSCSKDGKVDKNFAFNIHEARSRSPIFMDVPVDKRKNSKLFIYAGVHDGYTGSVPVTHSLKLYNKVASDWGASGKDLISDDIIIKLITYRGLSNMLEKIGDRRIYYSNNYHGKVNITMFEGGHEMLPGAAFDFMKGKGALVVGDSNGAMKNGWVDIYAGLRKWDFVYNTSVSGNTIGFDNNGDKKLNTLRNIDSYLDSTYKTIGHVEQVIIMLGTNDCKAVFKDKLNQVPKNMNKLICKIKSHPLYKKYHPEIIIVSPPPLAEDNKLKPKYYGGKERIEYFVPEFNKIANAEGCIYVDAYSKMYKWFNNYTTDGIHLSHRGHIMVAGNINNTIIFSDKNYNVLDYLPAIMR